MKTIPIIIIIIFLHGLESKYSSPAVTTSIGWNIIIIEQCLLIIIIIALSIIK